MSESEKRLREWIGQHTDSPNGHVLLELVLSENRAALSSARDAALEEAAREWLTRQLHNLDVAGAAAFLRALQSAPASVVPVAGVDPRDVDALGESWRAEAERLCEDMRERAADAAQAVLERHARGPLVHGEREAIAAIRALPVPDVLAPKGAGVDLDATGGNTQDTQDEGKP